MRLRLIPAVAALSVLAGCGGGGSGGGSGPAPAASRSEARFNVDLNTGKVTITPAGGRAVFQGGAVSFTSSDVFSASGDAGQRLIRIAARNNSGNVWGAAPVKLTVSSVVSADSAALRSNVAVSTYAGTGVTGGADGYRTSATFSSNYAMCSGAGPLAGSLIVITASTVRRIDAGGTVSTLAGQAGVLGFADGTGATAALSGATDIATDSYGNLFVADGDNRRIRRITPSGQVTTVAGTGVSGTSDGLGSVATFMDPFGVAVSPSGDRIYVADYGANNIRMVRYAGGARELATSYTVSLVAGTGFSGLIDGAAAARFYGPTRMALLTDPSGVETLFVADYYNNVVRRVSSPAGAAVVNTVVGDGVMGDADGPGSVARLRAPTGLSGQWLDASSFVLFVTDAGRVRAITCAAGGSPTQKGSYSVRTLAGGVAGFADGDGNAARFGALTGILAVGSGNGATLYVSDTLNTRVRRVTVPGGALHSGGAGTAVAETVRLANADCELPNRTGWSKTLTESSGVWTADLQFYVPSGVSGFSFLATVETDSNMMNLPAQDASTVSTLAGGSTAAFADGPGTQALLDSPQCVVSVPAAKRSLYRSPSGSPIRAFVTDWGNRRIRFLDVAGFVGVWAGSSYGSADGLGAAAQFQSPVAADLAPDGSLIVTDGNRIRRVWPNQQVTTVAGTGTSGSANGAGDVAQFASACGVAVNEGWQIYVADTSNHTIRRILLTGPDPRSSSSYTVSTVAGSPGSSGLTDGLGGSARFSHPLGLAADSDGRVYVADAINNAVRTLTPDSAAAVQVTTLATGQDWPSAVAVDSIHNVYVCRDFSWSIARIAPTGGVTMLAGSGSQGFTDGASGALYSPSGVTVEESGTLLFADRNAIRALSRIVDTAAP